MESNYNIKLHNPTIRIIKILESLSNTPLGLTLSEISRKTGSPKSTISPIIHTLLKEGYINRNNETARYNIGLKSFLVGTSYYSNCDSLEIVENEMKNITSICNEVCQLGILIDYSVFYLIKVDSDQPIKLISNVGSKFPAYATALGKALLSQLSDNDILDYYKDGLKPITQNTITDIKILLEQIDQVRNGKLAYELEEINEDTGCCAIPLKKDNKIIAAISVSFPLYRATNEKMELIEKTLYKQGAFIEQLINSLDLSF